MREEALLFGESQSLVGILSHPNREIMTDDAPGVLLLNAGFVHHVGPNRFSVNMARKLAGEGFPVLRFDFSGIGDSKVRADHVQFEKSTIDEIRQAMDFMQGALGSKRFVLMGLCSGADNAIRAAYQDRRVVGTILMEPYAFLSNRYYLWAYGRQAFRYKSWCRLLRGSSELWGVLQSKLNSSAQQTGDNWQEWLKEELVMNLQQIALRDIGLYFIYAEGGPAHYNYRVKLQDVLGKTVNRKNVHVMICPQSDHLFSSLDHQALLYKEIRGWIMHSFQGKRSVPE